MHADLASPMLVMTPPLAVLETRRTEPDPCTTVLEVTGELDLAAAPVLKHALADWLEGRTHGDLVIDLSAITHVDSTGLAVLLAFRRRLPDGCGLTLAAPSEPVTQLFALTGLDRAFAVLPSVEVARGSLLAARRRDDALPLTPDAAVAVGLAFTGLLFAESAAAEAERWARILLPYGDTELVGEIVDCGRVAEAETSSIADESPRDRLGRVVAHATRRAVDGEQCGVRTGDLVAGVVMVYGALFTQALQAEL